MLCFLAQNCEAAFHIKNLTTGGEFVTHVRVLSIILGIPFIREAWQAQGNCKNFPNFLGACLVANYSRYYFSPFKYTFVGFREIFASGISYFNDLTLDSLVLPTKVATVNLDRRE